MTSSLILTFRESLEAALIVGIILTSLTQQNKQSLKSYVIGGALIGLAVSVIGGVYLYITAKGLDEATFTIVEGVMMLSASALIAYFVIWLSNQNQDMGASISANVAKSSTGIGLAILAFLGIFREGLELVIFTLANLSANATDVAAGTLIGVMLAALTGWLIFRSSVKLNLNWIFKGLGLVLIYLGAQQLTEGLVKLIPTVESFETIILIAYIGIALFVYLKQDLRRLTHRPV